MLNVIGLDNSDNSPAASPFIVTGIVISYNPTRLAPATFSFTASTTFAFSSSAASATLTAISTESAGFNVIPLFSKELVNVSSAFSAITNAFSSCTTSTVVPGSVA